MNVKDSLPPGMSPADMTPDGRRWCLLHCYGGPFEQKSVDYAMMAWDVKKRWLINPTATGVSRVPAISTEGGPKYMLLFGDGKWRYASFGGLNGQPCASCQWEGFEAPNGEAAYHMMTLAQKIRHREDREQQVAALATEIAGLKERLSASMKTPERKDETWQRK